jgi:hypothetical protein
MSALVAFWRYRKRSRRWRSRASAFPREGCRDGSARNPSFEDWWVGLVHIQKMKLDTSSSPASQPVPTDIVC